MENFLSGRGEKTEGTVFLAGKRPEMRGARACRQTSGRLRCPSAAMCKSPKKAVYKYPFGKNDAETAQLAGRQADVTRGILGFCANSGGRAIFLTKKTHFFEVLLAGTRNILRPCSLLISSLNRFPLFQPTSTRQRITTVSVDEAFRRSFFQPTSTRQRITTSTSHPSGGP